MGQAIKISAVLALQEAWERLQGPSEIFSPDACLKKFATYVMNIRCCAPEDLHGGFSVGVVGGFEAELGEPQPREEELEDANEMPQGQPHIADNTCRHEMRMDNERGTQSHASIGVFAALGDKAAQAGEFLDAP